MGEEQVSGKKSLGQVAYEALWQAQSRAVGCGIPPWPTPRDVMPWWEAAGEAVKAAVLAKQAEPQGTEGMAQQEQDMATMVYHAVRLTLAESPYFGPENQRLISTAIERGIMAGLRVSERSRRDE
jgi:hypothetical protein